MAERVGFEPTIPCGILAFQASALGQLRYLSSDLGDQSGAIITCNLKINPVFADSFFEQIR